MLRCRVVHKSTATADALVGGPCVSRPWCEPHSTLAAGASFTSTASKSATRSIVQPPTVSVVVTSVRISLPGARVRSEPGITAWPSLAAAGHTLAIYMGATEAASVRDRLLDAGAAAATPVAIIENGTRPDQRVVHTTLGDMARAIAVAGIGSPAIMVIGDVARAADAAIRVTRSA